MKVSIYSLTLFTIATAAMVTVCIATRHIPNNHDQYLHHVQKQAHEKYGHLYIIIDIKANKGSTSLHRSKETKAVFLNWNLHQLFHIEGKMF